MKITFLGQTSILIETDTASIMIDPYLTDYLHEFVGPQFQRLVPVDDTYLKMHPDMILLSHEHGDHTDPPSLKALLGTEKPVRLLAGAHAWEKVRKSVMASQRFVQLTPGCQWTQGDIQVRAVPAFHSDDTAVGFLVRAEGKTVYYTGDTLYNEAIIEAIDEPVDAMFTVMNGLGNNMNSIDAARLAEKIQPKLAVPVHWGMFAQFTAPPEEFVDEATKRGVQAIIMQAYEQIQL